MKMKSILAVLFLIVCAAAALAATPPDQPLMVAARADLNKAKTQLQLALHDKGGHRAKAVGLVNSAIAEVNAGIAYDRRHNHAVALSVEDLFASSPDQPHMERAKDALESAKNNLERATADKGGHRAKALDLVRDAIDEVKKGIEAGRS